MSHTLNKVPENLTGKVEILSENLKSLIDHLQKRGYLNLYVDGGKVIQSFLQLDLIDDMIMTTIPVLLGDGIPLFGKLPTQLKFTHEKTEILNEQLVKSYYKRVGE
jgi:dihydrofolate reductase